MKLWPRLRHAWWSCAALVDDLGAWMLRDTPGQRRGVVVVLVGMFLAGLISQLVMYVERAGR